MKSSTVRMGQLILQLQFLCSKMGKVLSNKISTVGKQYFFDRQRIRFFLISCLFYLIFSIKQKTNHTTRCTVKSSTIYIIQLILQLHFLLWKSTTFWRIKFRRCKKMVFFWYPTNAFFSYLSPDPFYLNKQNAP